MGAIATIEDIHGLLAGAIPSRPPWGFAYLATKDGSGTARVRTMTLRGYDAAAGTLWTTCHSTSQKVVHLRSHPEAEICLWLAEQGVQLRVLARWLVVDAAVADPNLQALRLRTWEQQPPDARSLYEPPPPGEAPPTFAVLFGTISTIDALLIGPAAYAHYQHQRLDNGRWQSEKLAR